MEINKSVTQGIWEAGFVPLDGFNTSARGRVIEKAFQAGDIARIWLPSKPALTGYTSLTAAVFQAIVSGYSDTESIRSFLGGCTESKQIHEALINAHALLDTISSAELVTLDWSDTLVDEACLDEHICECLASMKNSHGCIDHQRRESFNEVVHRLHENADPRWYDYGELCKFAGRTKADVVRFQSECPRNVWGPIEGLDQLLHILKVKRKEKGQLFGIVTHCFSDMLALRAQLIGIDLGIFDFIVTADMVEDPADKSSMMRKMLRESGVTPDAWVHVGDDMEGDVLGAMRLGGNAILARSRIRTKQFQWTSARTPTMHNLSRTAMIRKLEGRSYGLISSLDQICYSINWDSSTTNLKTPVASESVGSTSGNPESKMQSARRNPRQQFAASNKKHLVPRDEEGFTTMVAVALPKELGAMMAVADSTVGLPSMKDDPHVYRCISFDRGGEQRRVLLAVPSAMGKANITNLVANAVRSYPSLEHIVLAGIAGGCPNPVDGSKHVRLGDIVVAGSQGVFEYDYVKLTEDEVEYRASSRIPSCRLLQWESELQAREYLGERPWQPLTEQAVSQVDRATRPSEEDDKLFVDGNQIEHPSFNERIAGQPHIFRGRIGSADTLLKDPSLRDKLSSKFGVLAVEMEGSGLANASWAANKGFIVVRGICDYCDSHKNDVWQLYAACSAAGYTRALLETIPVSEFYPDS